MAKAKPMKIEITKAQLIEAIENAEKNNVNYRIKARCGKVKLSQPEKEEITDSNDETEVLKPSLSSLNGAEIEKKAERILSLLNEKFPQSDDIVNP